MRSARPDPVVASVAFALAALSALVAGAALDGYRHDAHPLGLLGGRGLPGAAAFNVAGFLAPGVMAAWVAVRMRGRLPDARMPARLAPWLLAISALAYAAQGVLPLDPRDIHAPASRQHAVAWTLWWLAGVPAALAIAFGVGRHPGWRPLPGIAALVAAALVLFCALPPLLLPAPIGQRAASLAWWGLVLGVALAPRRAGQP